VRFRVRYSNPAELIADHDQQFTRGGFLVRVDPPEGLALYESVELEIATEHGSVALAGQVVQMVPSVGVAIGFRAADDPALRELVDWARTAAAVGAAAEHGVAGAPEPEAAPSCRAAAVPQEAHAKVKAANKVDKIHLARYGKKDERMHIIRGNDRSLHRYVLNNPGLGMDEVAFIAKMTTMSPDMLKAIAERREWAQRPEIAIALARNPKTPVPLAIKMLNHVSPTDLRNLAKGTGARMPIVQAARKKVLR
jgi:hypothetical protein